MKRVPEAAHQDTIVRLRRFVSLRLAGWVIAGSDQLFTHAAAQLAVEQEAARAAVGTEGEETTFLGADF